MAEIAVAGQGETTGEKVGAAMARPYAPSWIDRLTDWVRGLPGPSWPYYLLLAVVIRLMGFVAGGVETGNWATLDLFPIMIGLAFSYSLGLIHYLDNVAAEALARFRPAMVIDEADYELVRYRLTTMPALPTLLASLAGAGIAVSILVITGLDFYNRFGIFKTPVLGAIQGIVYVLLFGILGTLCYHTLRQLRLVSSIYSTCTEVNLFNLPPLYAFSWLTARTSVGLILVPYVWILTAPRLLDQPYIAGIFVGFGVIAAITFVWPLLGIHRLLVEEKERERAENGERIAATMTELHRRVDERELGGREELKNTMDGLVAGRRVLDDISTWPWRPETMRGVAIALLLPIIVWLITRVLERLGF
jgi:hypothetical protein